MATHAPLPIPLTRWLLGRRRASRLGFTLTELLVALIVGTLIMGSLLYFVVELLGVNAREERLTQVQQDMNRALQYIERDLREAAYVYADPATVAGLLSGVDTLGTPALAFWRTEPIALNDVTGDANTLGPCTGRTGAALTQCEILRARQVTYELVIYFVRPNNEPGNIWSGPNRLVRYRFPAYSDLDNLTFRTGYVDPLSTGFAQWAPSGNTTSGTSAVLVDSVDGHDDDFEVECPDDTSPSPATAAIDANSFFTCFPDSALAADGSAQADASRSLTVFLRGNLSRDNSTITFGPAAEASRLPTLSTEVQARGVTGRVDPNTTDR